MSLPSPSTPGSDDAEKLAGARKGLLSLFSGAKTDEERFAALLMLSKAVPEGDLDAIQEVYQVTGVGFISRLLHTTAVPAGCPPDAYQAIAASLLGSFAASPAVASEPAVLELAEPLLEMLEPVPAASAAFTADGAPRQAQQQPAPAPLPSQTDAVEALAGMAATPEGRACLLRAVADRQLAEFVSRPESQVAPEAAIAGLRALSLLAADRSGGGAGGGGGIRCSGDRVCKAANAMAACFSIRKDRGTLEAAELLIALLDHVRGTFEPGTPTYDAVGSIKARWPASVGKGLAGLLQNKLGPEVREMLLQLAALTVEWHGVGWATAAQIAPAPSAAAAASTSASTSESASSTLLSLLVELCCIELRMGLEDRYVIDVLKNGALITACYVIFEAAIAAVVAPNSSTTKLPLEVLERLHGRFGEGLQAVMEFMITVHTDATCNLEKDVQVAALVDSSIRVLAMWLAEETEAHRDQVNSILPFVLARISATVANHNSSAPNPSSATPTSPTLASSGASGSAPESFDSSPELLRLFLPALCHLTADDDSRQICVAAKCVETVAGKLEAAWLPWIANNDVRVTDALVQSAATACGVLLNILILEGAAAAQHPAAAALLVRMLAAVGTGGLTYAAKPVLVANTVVVCLRILLHTTSADLETGMGPGGAAQWSGFAAGASQFLAAGVASAPQQDLGFSEDLLDLWHLAVQSLPDACRRHGALHAALKGTGLYAEWEKAAAAGSGNSGSGAADDVADELPHPNLAVADSLARLHL